MRGASSMIKKEVDLKKLAKLLNVELIDIKNFVTKVNSSSDVKIEYTQ
jgi:hypothetical protein